MATKVFTDEFTDVNPMADDTYWLGSDTLGWKGVKFPDTKIYQVDATTIGIRTIADGGANFNLADGATLQHGTDGDIKSWLQADALGANPAAVAGKIIGTSVMLATAANSWMVSNITANGDIHFVYNVGGNSKTALLLDGSAHQALFMSAPFLIPVTPASGAGTTTASPSFTMQNQYRNGADAVTNWNYAVAHTWTSCAGGTVPISYVTHSINSAEILRLTNSNASISAKFSVTTNLSILTSSAGDGFLLRSTATGTSGPALTLDHIDGEVGVANDVVGQIYFGGSDATPSYNVYANVKSTINSAAAGAECGTLQLFACVNATLAKIFEISGNAGVSNIGFFAATAVPKQTGIAAQKVNYATPDLDTEAEIIVAFNTTNAAINALRTALNNYGLTTVV